MFLALFILLLVVWLIVWAALHLVGGGIHLLLVLAIIFLIVHFARGRRAVLASGRAGSCFFGHRLGHGFAKTLAQPRAEPERGRVDFLVVFNQTDFAILALHEWTIRLSFVASNTGGG